jgi:inorganic pyrophosphatase
MNVVVDVVVEIPKGSQNKYEVDHVSGRIRLDRVLFSPFHYPTDYGYVPETLGEDEDPIDVMVLISQPTFPGCIVRGRVVGMLAMSDEKGVDTKILAVAEDDPRFREIQELDQVTPHLLKEISHFFSVYKTLEGKTTAVGNWEPRTSGEAKVQESIERYHHGS